MTATRKPLLTRQLVITGAMVLVLISAGLLLTNRKGTPEQRHIAEACLEGLRSPLTNEVDVQPDDPRLPAAIRELHPVAIMLDPRSVVVMIQPKDGLVEYHLAPVSLKDPTRGWLLLGAGPKFNNDHRELLRILSQ